MKAPTQTAADQHVSTLLRAVLAADGMSRAELARATGLRPNTVGQVVQQMVQSGWLRESKVVSQPEAVAQGEPGSAAPSRGRPAIRVEIDPDGCEVLGLALSPRWLRAVSVNLLGQPMGPTETVKVTKSVDLPEAAAKLAKRMVGKQTAAMGVSAPGLVDEARMQLLFGSTAPQSRGLSLAGLLKAAGDLPLALENDMHALGDRWRLSCLQVTDQTVVLVSLADGAVGASIMTGGHAADAGCVRGGNELGHMQIDCGGRDVPVCYCGQSRCVERVFSSQMVQALEGAKGQLVSALQAVHTLETGDVNPAKSTGDWIVDRLSEAVANVVNLVRPHRLVWVGSGAINRVLGDLAPVLSDRVAERLLPVLRERVVFDRWCPQAGGQRSCAAVTAGHLGIAVLTGQRVSTAGAVSLRG